MARLPSTTKNLPALFAHALKSFESDGSNFRVLCSLPFSSTTSSSSDSATEPSPPRQSPRYILVLDSSFNPPTLAHHRMVLSALSDPRYKSKTKTQDGEATERCSGMLETSSTSRVLLLLAINNADKAPKPAAFPQRLAMMYAFAQGIIASSRSSEASTEAIDIAVTTEPYFHAKAESIAISDFYMGANAEMSLNDDEDEPAGGAVSTDNASESDQVFLTGYDTLIRIFDPKYYRETSMRCALDTFFAHAILRVRMRTGDNWGEAAEQIGYLEELRNGRLEDVDGRKEWVDRIELVQGRGDDEPSISSSKVRDAVVRKDWEGLGGLVGEGVVDWIRENGLYTSDEIHEVK